MLKTTIVLPCYNEGLRLEPESFKSFLEANPGFSLLFVDDGSSDLTPDVLKRALAICPEGRADSIRLPRNSGKAAAVRDGFLKAMYGDCEVLGFMDSDLAAPLDEAPRLLAPIERGEANIALGSRIAMLGCEISRSALNHYMGRVFATFASLALELPVHDTQCGAKLFRNCPDLKELFAEPFDVNWTFDVELLARLKAAGSFNGSPFPKGIVEIPLKRWTQKGGSKAKPADFLLSLLELVKIRSRMKDKLAGRG